MRLTPIKANMTELEIGNKRVLFSYKTPVAYQELTTIGDYYKTNKKWSQTTTRHINQWLGGNGAKFVDQETIDNLVEGQ